MSKKKALIRCAGCGEEITSILAEKVTDITCGGCGHVNNKANWVVVREVDEYAFMIREGSRAGKVAILHIAANREGLNISVLDESDNVVSCGVISQFFRLGYITPNDLVGARVRKEPPKIVP